MKFVSRLAKVLITGLDKKGGYIEIKKASREKMLNKIPLATRARLLWFE